MLAAHSSLATSDERPWLGRLIRRIGADYPPAVAALDAAATAQLRQEYFDCVGADLGARVDGQRIVDKDPFNFVRLGLVRRIFPDAKIIFVNRDPRDVVLSCFMQWFQPNDAAVNFFDLDSAARLYVDAMALWHDLKVVLDLDILEIRYEDLVVDFPTISRQVFDFINLEWEADILNFADTAVGTYVATPSRRDVAKNIFSQSVGRWRNYHRQMAPTLGVLSTLVSMLGYADS